LRRGVAAKSAHARTAADSTRMKTDNQMRLGLIQLIRVHVHINTFHTISSATI
jgi:hypothetical protein